MKDIEDKDTLLGGTIVGSVDDIEVKPTTQGEVKGGAVVVGEVNTEGGDFVGRDIQIFQTVGGTRGTVVGVQVSATRQKMDRIGSQVERLRGRIARLIPAEEMILNLAELREPRTSIVKETGAEVSFPLPIGTTRAWVKQKEERVDLGTVLSKPASDFLERVLKVKLHIYTKIAGFRARRFSIIRTIAA